MANVIEIGWIRVQVLVGKKYGGQKRSEGVILYTVV